MSVRDDVRLAVEMERGMLDRFIESRMRSMRIVREVTGESFSYVHWLLYGEPQRKELWQLWANAPLSDEALIKWWTSNSEDVLVEIDGEEFVVEESFLALADRHR